MIHGKSWFLLIWTLQLGSSFAICCTFWPFHFGYFCGLFWRKKKLVLCRPQAHWAPLGSYGFCSWPSKVDELQSHRRHKTQLELSFSTKCYLQVSWLRHDDTHLLTIGRLTYTSDMRFKAIHKLYSEDYLLQIKPTTHRDSGKYACQISTTPPNSHIVTLNIAGTLLKNKLKTLRNIASEASYVYILSGQKFIKNAKLVHFSEFLKSRSLLSNRSILIEQKVIENAKIQMRHFGWFSNIMSFRNPKREEMIKAHFDSALIIIGLQFFVQRQQCCLVVYWPTQFSWHRILPPALALAIPLSSKGWSSVDPVLVLLHILRFSNNEYSHHLHYFLGQYCYRYTMFENNSKCHIFDFRILAFSTNFLVIKVTCLVTLFDRKIFKNSPKWTIFGNLNELLSTQNVNVARFARNLTTFFVFSDRYLVLRSLFDAFSRKCALWTLGQTPDRHQFTTLHHQFFL